MFLNSLFAIFKHLPIGCLLGPLLLMTPISCNIFKSRATVGSEMFNVCAISFLVIEGDFLIRLIILLWRFFIVSFVVSFIVSLIYYFDKKPSILFCWNGPINGGSFTKVEQFAFFNTMSLRYLIMSLILF